MSQIEDDIRSEQMSRGHKMAQQYLTDKQFAKRFEHTAKIAKQTFEKDGFHGNMMFAHMKHKATGVWSIVPMLFDDMPPPAEKFQAMNNLGILLAADHPDDMMILLTHVSEGWAAPDDEIQPSQNPKRIEVLIVAALSVDCRQSYITTEIRHNRDGSFKGWRKHTAQIYEPGSTSIDPRKGGDFLLAAVIQGYVNAMASGRKS